MTKPAKKGQHVPVPNSQLKQAIRRLDLILAKLQNEDGINLSEFFDVCELNLRKVKEFPEHNLKTT